MVQPRTPASDPTSLDARRSRDRRRILAAQAKLTQHGLQGSELEEAKANLDSALVLAGIRQQSPSTNP